MTRRRALFAVASGALVLGAGWWWILNRLPVCRMDVAHVMVRSVAQMVELYRLDHGAYRTQQQGLAILVPEYVRAEGLADPWGAPLRYDVPGSHGAEFDVYTLGADRRPRGTGDSADRGSWQIDYPTGS